MKILTKLLCPTLIAVLTLSGCSLGSKKPVEKTQEPIKIGVSAPLSGPGASYGDGFMTGAELAAKEINDSGGISGQLVKLIVEDDKCSTDAVTAFNKLINIDKVAGIIGSLCSAAMGPAVSTAQSGKTPTIIQASAPDLTIGKDYIFRNYPSDTFQGKFAAEYARNKLGKTKAAIIYELSDYSQGLKDTFQSGFQALGGQITYNEGVLSEANDIRTQIIKAKASSPDILYFPTAKNTALWLTQIKELGFNVLVMGGDGYSADIIYKMPSTEGAIFTAAKTSNPEDFQKKIKDATGKESSLFTPYGYDALMVMTQAIKNAGSIDHQAIRDALAKIKYDKSVAVPVVEFDENGDLKTAEYEIKVIKNGEIVDYQP